MTVMRQSRGTAVGKKNTTHLAKPFAATCFVDAPKGWEPVLRTPPRAPARLSMLTEPEEKRKVAGTVLALARARAQGRNRGARAKVPKAYASAGVAGTWTRASTRTGT